MKPGQAPDSPAQRRALSALDDLERRVFRVWMEAGLYEKHDVVTSTVRAAIAEEKARSDGKVEKPSVIDRLEDHADSERQSFDTERSAWEEAQDKKLSDLAVRFGEGDAEGKWATRIDAAGKFLQILSSRGE
jgi:hypothetical protein